MALNQSDINSYLEKQKKRQELIHYFVSFVLMILFTVLAFVAVMLRDSINDYLIAVFIVTMAVVQVVFQLYYFMHMKEQDHGFPTLFLYSGAAVAFLTVISFVSIVWIS
ncbi:cytochrome c oxidase subunit 4B [Pullulanibacillus camelliae]|uniref:Cytochrome c oxidase subunit 4B n=1 Tax=Pullulanibacillus camelliae TaxID=1707096 RepID=A0A8J2VUP3_9BACL|nr:cytochrome C oxidase subunit IV family protein [Pullulanibacillus camelliae]GGE41093.1 cytochrome c oxidase subunit 4B [Pullulanibacillus camelliae]